MLDAVSVAAMTNCVWGPSLWGIAAAVGFYSPAVLAQQRTAAEAANAAQVRAAAEAEPVEESTAPDTAHGAPHNAVGQQVEADALALEPSQQTAPASPGVPGAPPTATPRPIAKRSPPTRLADMPKHQRYHGEAQLDGYVLEERWRPALAIPGLALVGAAYFSGLAIGSFDDYDNQKGFLAIPVVGPWITLMSREDDCDDDFCAPDRLLVASGVMQAIGLGLVIVGTTWSKRLWVREDLVVNLAPQHFAQDGYGAALYGTF